MRSWFRKKTHKARTGKQTKQVTPGVIRQDTPYEVKMKINDLDAEIRRARLLLEPKEAKAGKVVFSSPELRGAERLKVVQKMDALKAKRREWVKKYVKNGGKWP